jgi:OOP family OmpA-OmpF porin
MTALQAKMSNLQKNPDAANHKEISRLRARIDSLNSSLKDANRSLELQPGRANKKKRNNSLSMLMQNYRQTIYFANNSTVLNSADKSLLLQLAQMIKRSGKQVTVLVQGYASHTGSALYNYKISLKRAEAVKNVLTNDGVNAEKIETIAHGISKSRSASAARRAEISLFVNG